MLIFISPIALLQDLCYTVIVKQKSKGGEAVIDVVNLKCAPEVIESLVGDEPGVYRAYHMNKTHWLSLDLGECSDDTVLWLLGISYELTDRRGRRK